MTFRAILALLGCALATAHAAVETYQRAQLFESPPKNWRYFNPNQGYGYYPSDNGTTGFAGGFFFPKTYTSYYADTALNGAFHRGTPLSASGKIHVDELSFAPNYTNTVYVGHFRKGSTRAMFVNILGMAITGNNDGTVSCAPIVQFSNGSAYVGTGITVPVNAKPLPWSYDWDPQGGVTGLGLLTLAVGDETTTLTVSVSSTDLDYALDSFGLYQPAFVQPNSNSYFLFFINKVAYTALLGPSPKIHVKGPKTIHTSISPINLAGTAHTVVGNRVTSVRYRIVRNGKTGHYKAASGKDHWTARVRVPTGSSRIEITAFSDNGLSTTARRNVSRTP